MWIISNWVICIIPVKTGRIREVFDRRLLSSFLFSGLLLVSCPREDALFHVRAVHYAHALNGWCPDNGAIWEHPKNFRDRACGK